MMDQVTAEFEKLYDDIDQSMRLALQDRLEMDRSTQAILALAMVAGKIQTDHIPQHVKQCVQAGLGRTEIGETLMHVYCYAGVYPSIAAFKAAGATLKELDDHGQLTAEQAQVRNEMPPTTTAEARICA